MLERWRERDVFERQLAQRRDADAPIWSFYEGPPTANGKPGSHHVLSRVFKDVYPRYQAMRGSYVPRKAGWDCHGLPVELEVEKELGISSKAEIEEYGIAEFNARCRESVFRYVEDWNRLTERIGFWIDLGDPYVTLENDYIESVWWSLRQIWDQGRLYEGNKVVPYCPRCGTTLSSHEVALGYEDVEDPSVYVRFPVMQLPSASSGSAPTAGSAPIEVGDSLLAWTTTPWTLISNAALAVGREIEYARVRVGDEVLILARDLIERVLGEGAEILAQFPGAALAGTRYEPPFTYISDYGPNGHTVLEGDFVTTDEGTGIVHTAIAFGEDDFRLGERYEITLQNPVRADGTFDERVADFAGRFVKDADPAIVEVLRTNGRLLRSEIYEHSYPHCWRCGTALLYYAKSSWYVRTTDVRDRMLAENERIGWHPEHVKHGRFGKWLEGNVDWALSRERYWGTPLPIWECDSAACEARFCAGSLADLRERGGELPDDLHRPYIDDVKLACHACGGEMRRVEEVIDTWYDSGAMPFAQFHHPFEGREQFAAAVPGRLHLRSAGSDPGLVLLAARDLDPGLRPGELSQLRLPRPHPRPRGPEDVEEPRQRGRSLGGARRARCRRPALVLPQLTAALGRLPLLRRCGRRIGSPVHAHALEHVLVLGPVRERRGDRAGRPEHKPSCRERRRQRRRSRAAGRCRSRPLGPVEAPGHHPRGDREDGRVRLHDRRPRDRRLRRGAVELVRPALAAALLGR